MADRHHPLWVDPRCRQPVISLQGALQRLLGDALDTLAVSAESGDDAQHSRWADCRQWADMRRMDDAWPICYRSAIAYQLRSILGLSLEQSLTVLKTQMMQQIQTDTMAQCPKGEIAQPVFWTFSVDHPGLLACHVTRHGISAWLDQLNQCEVASLPSDDSVATPKTMNCRDQSFFQPDLFQPDLYFKLQHLHARCCSQLSSAHQRGMITLNRDLRDPTREPQAILDPTAIPWLAVAPSGQQYSETDSSGADLSGAYLLKTYLPIINAIVSIWDWRVASDRDRRTNPLPRRMETLLRQVSALIRERAPGNPLSPTPALAMQGCPQALTQNQLACGILRAIQLTLKYSLTHLLGQSAPQKL